MEKDRTWWRDKLKGGLIPAVPALFHRDGVIHRDAQQRYCEFMAQQDIRGVAVWVHTGRGLLLSPENREFVMSAWRQCMTGNKIIVAGVGATAEGAITSNTDLQSFFDKTKEMGRDALNLGADAFLAFPPFPLQPADKHEDEIVAYHEEIAQLGAPVFAFYFYEGGIGLPYSDNLLRKLFEIEAVVGIKVATFNDVVRVQDIARLIEESYPDVLFVSGEDRMLPYTIMRGAVCGLVGMGSICTDLQVRLFKSYFAGKAKEFLKLAEKVDRLGEATFLDPLEGYVLRLLWALELQGIIPTEAARDPYGPELPPEQKTRLETVLRSIGELK
jgi:4-hydroxy-tetrahydrodipicolinate synthase